MAIPTQDTQVMLSEEEEEEDEESELDVPPINKLGKKKVSVKPKTSIRPRT